MSASLPTPMHIPEEELIFQATHASGPGGQGVNTADSAVMLRWCLATTRALPPEAKERMARLCRRWMTREGWVVISADERRSQWMNRQAARQRLEEMAEKALIPPKKRRKTAVPRSQKEERRGEKKRRSLRLQERKGFRTARGEE